MADDHPNLDRQEHIDGCAFSKTGDTMLELAPEAVREIDVEDWEDQLLIAALYFGGVMVISWCAVLMGLAWWLISLRW